MTASDDRHGDPADGARDEAQQLEHDPQREPGEARDDAGSRHGRERLGGADRAHPPAPRHPPRLTTRTDQAPTPASGEECSHAAEQSLQARLMAV